jgi:hypothetical protein
MVKVVRVFKSHEDAERADREFLERLTPTQRIELVMQYNAQIWEEWREPVARLERVYRIVERGRR